MKSRKALLPFALAGLAGCGTGHALTTHTYDVGSPLAAGAAAGCGMPTMALVAAETAPGGSIEPASYQQPSGQEPSVDEGRDRPVTADPLPPELPSDELAEEAANEARDTGRSDAADGAAPLAAPVPLPVDGVLPDDHPPAD